MPQARIGITLDGYSAPLTAGNFAANVQDGVYDGKPVNASYASVLAGRGAIPGLSADFWAYHKADLKHTVFSMAACPCAAVLTTAQTCLTNAALSSVSHCAFSRE